jgi:hypothetical protein
VLPKYTRKQTRERLVDRLIQRRVFVDKQFDNLAQTLS